MNWDVPRNFYATNPFGNMIENTTQWETLTDNLQEPTITNVFAELMSDFIPNAEQIMEMTTAAEQLDSSIVPIQWMVPKIPHEIMRGHP